MCAVVPSLLFRFKGQDTIDKNWEPSGHTYIHVHTERQAGPLSFSFLPNVCTDVPGPSKQMFHFISYQLEVQGENKPVYCSVKMILL